MIQKTLKILNVFISSYNVFMFIYVQHSGYPCGFKMCCIIQIIDDDDNINNYIFQLCWARLKCLWPLNHSLPIPILGCKIQSE